MNPYYDVSFWQFFIVLVKRITLFFGGTSQTLASDELQLIVFGLIALSSCLVGTFLVLRKMAMLANGLSHTILLGIALVVLSGTLFLPGSQVETTHLALQESTVLFAALSMALVTTFLSEFFISRLKLKEDASLAIVFTFLFALGVIIVTVYSRNAHIGTELLMGSSDNLSISDMIFLCRIALFNLILFTLLYRGFFATSFDPQFSAITGFSPALFGYLLMLATALTATAAFRAVGVLLVLTFFVGPPLIARLVTKQVMPLIVVALGIALGISLFGVALSRHLLSVYNLPVSTGALVVTLLVFVYICMLAVVLFTRRRA